MGQPSKQGWLYAFDRITGEPIWPMPETPVPQTNVPGEKTSPTQPFPSKPPLYSRNYLAKDDVIDFTPELRAQGAREPEEVPLGADRRSRRTCWPTTRCWAASRLGTPWAASTGRVRPSIPRPAVFFTQANNSSVGTGALSHEDFEKIKPETHHPNHIAIWEAPGFAQPGFEAPTRRAVIARPPRAAAAAAVAAGTP